MLDDRTRTKVRGERMSLRKTRLGSWTCGLAESGTGYDCANTPKPGDVTTANSDFKGCSSAATFSVGAQFLDCYYSPCTFTVP